MMRVCTAKEGICRVLWCCLVSPDQRGRTQTVSFATPPKRSGTDELPTLPPLTPAPGGRIS